MSERDDNVATLVSHNYLSQVQHARLVFGQARRT
jgi:hypothetical protein